MPTASTRASPTWPRPRPSVTRSSKRWQAEGELAQERGQLLALLDAQGLQEPRLVGQVRAGDAVDQLVALVRERDERAAAVVRVRLARDQARVLELVQPLGRSAGREHDRTRQVGGAQLERRALAAQRG